MRRKSAFFASSQESGVMLQIVGEWISKGKAETRSDQFDAVLISDGPRAA